MSVLSKALRLAVFVGLVAGCTTSKVELAPQDDASGGASASLTSDTSASTAEAVASASTTEQITNIAQSGIEISANKGQGFSKFSIASNSALSKYEVFEMAEPNRIVLDLSGTTATPGTFNLANDSYIRSIRVGSHKDRVRIVFDLAQNASPVLHDANAVDGRVNLVFSSSAETARNALTNQNTTVLASTATGASLPPASKVEEKSVEQKSTASNEEIPVRSVAPAVAAAAPAQAASLDQIRFDRTAEANRSQITLGVSSPVAFDLKQTAPTEYTLTLKNATASEKTQLPQIAPAGFPIRSARAVQHGSDVQVRMFTDTNALLSAASSDAGIQVSAYQRNPNEANEGRAQMDQSKPATEAPVAKEAAPKSETGAAKLLESDDEAARKNPTGIPSADGSKLYSGRLISLDLQETDIDNALRIIAEVSNLNIIASEDVQGKVTLRLIDVPWDQALDVILKTHGLDQVTEGNVIRIAPVDKLREERQALLEAKKAAENLEDLKVKYVRISYAKAAEIKEQVESVLSERGSVSVDERTNQLIVKDINKGQEEMLQLIKRLDLRTPQVLLETQIVEASRNMLRDLGFQWNFTYAASAATGNATGKNFPNSVLIGGDPAYASGNAVNFPATNVQSTGPGSAIGAVLGSADGSRALSLRLTMYEQEGKVKVISRPQVATVNNKEAEIKSVETVRVKLPSSGTSVATGAGASASAGGSSAFQEIDVGITLRVTPQASPDYYVLLDVYAKSSTFGDKSVDSIPSTREREATSTILVKSGQTFALGGVYQISDTDSVLGVPFFKDIPVLGAMFRETSINKGDQELIFFITPHIVEGSFDSSAM